MKNWKVGYKTIDVKEGKKVKKEIIIQADSLADIEYTALQFLQEQTNMPEEIEITDAKRCDYSTFVINDLVAFDGTMKGEDKKFVEGAIYESQEAFLDNTYFFEAVVEFFEAKEDGTMKKSSSIKLLIPAENVKKATEECEAYMSNEVTDWKIKDVKTTKISSIIILLDTYNAALELKSLVHGEK